MNDINFVKKVINKSIITTGDACKITDLSKSRIFKRVETGKLNYIRKTSAGIIFYKDDIQPNIDRTGRIIKKFDNNEFDVINLLMSGYKIIVTGSVRSGKTTLLDKIRKYAEENYSVFKLFDDDEIPENYLKIPYSSLAIVQADDELEALSYLSRYLNASIDEIKDNVDFICTLESNQITILKIDEVLSS